VARLQQEAAATAELTPQSVVKAPTCGDVVVSPVKPRLQRCVLFGGGIVNVWVVWYGDESENRSDCWWLLGWWQLLLDVC
jgi:hypothetical protein